MAHRPVVMLSSTVRDLTAHREQAREACLRADFFPKMMEHLPAVSADAISASLEMVDEADVYVGILGFRYGHVPEGHDKSITQMEAERGHASRMCALGAGGKQRRSP